MRFMETTLRKLRRAKGQTMTEYALILATIAVVLSGFYTHAGVDLETLVTKVGGLL